MSVSVSRTVLATSVGLTFCFFVGACDRTDYELEHVEPDDDEGERVAPNEREGDQREEVDCNGVSSRYGELTAAARSDCELDTECACFGSIGSPGWGGAARRDDLGAIQRVVESYVRNCPTVAVYWEPTRCDGHCRDGVCQMHESPMGGL